MSNKFKRDYDNGTVTLHDGRVINVLSLPAASMNYFAVYGFIRACQDPNGGEKDEAKREAGQMEIANALIAGTHDKKTRTFGSNLEDKLDETNAKLVAYVAANDDMKKFLCTMGISRGGLEAEIKKIEAAIKKRDEKAKGVNATPVPKKTEEGEISAGVAEASAGYENDSADDVEVDVETA